MIENEQPDETDSDPTEDLSDSVRQRLLAAVGNATVPFVETAHDELPAPAAGQFWRARWNDLATAVLITATPDRDHIQAAAVTFDTDLADQTARVAPAAVTTLGLNVVIWWSDMVELPLAVLDRHLGAVEAEDTDPNTVTRFLSAQTVPGPVQDVVERHTGLRASLKDDLTVLANASWLSDSVDDDAVNLTSLKTSRIAEALNIAMNDALQVKRGARRLTAEQAQILATVANPADQAVDRAQSQARVSEVVVSLFNGPDIRASVVALAALQHEDENKVREAVAYEIALNVAARATGDMADEEAERHMWCQRIEQYFEVKLGQDGS
jgi:hypothetical protein